MPHRLFIDHFTLTLIGCEVLMLNFF